MSGTVISAPDQDSPTQRVRGDQDAPSNTISFDDAFLRRLERLALRVGRMTGAVGSRPGPRRTPAADFIDHRPYSPGDDLRHIDWPAAARHEEVFVKVGQAPQAAHVHLCLDVSPSMAADPAKRRLSLELAAALGWLSLNHGDRVTLATFPAAASASPLAEASSSGSSPGETSGTAAGGRSGSSVSGLWGPASGAGFSRALLRHLMELSHIKAPATPLVPTMDRLVRASPVGGLLVLISDLWVADELDLALAKAPPPRWEVLVLHLLGREELEPTLVGPLELQDVESGETLTLVIDDALRAEYRRTLSQRLERLRTLIGAKGAGYAMIPADWPLEQAIIPYLQQRAVLA